MQADPGIFALLDDRDGISRLFTGFVRQLTCAGPEDLPAVLDEMQGGLDAGLHAVLAFRYELGAAMQGIPSRDTASYRAPHAARSPGEADRRPAVVRRTVPQVPQPPSQILLFKHCDLLDQTAVDAWLAQHSNPQPSGIANLRASVDEAEFHHALYRIHDYIAAGDTYQVNYTYRLRFDAFGGIHALYRRLRARQPVPYGALIALPDGGALLSLSPELFVRHQAGQLTARPMKGTAPAGADAQAERDNAKALAADPKNRAENLMIVDLLRNDLGRIAATGTVEVPALFEVNRFASVLQMTSTVTAQLRPGLGLAEIFAGLYPCGSITGAPKRRTMEIIRELEGDARGFYTGAIGWFEAPQHGARVGKFCMSVPIRTLSLEAEQDGVRRGEMGVGAGIVYDSQPAEEFEECRLKARFLTGLANEFEIFETMHGNPQGVAHLALHLARLQASADYFGFPFEREAAQRAVEAACKALPGDARLRLSLKADGGLALQSAALQPLQLPVKVFVALKPMHSDDLFLRHKTSIRSDYDAAWKSAEQQGGFDSLFVNQRGEVTEGGRSSVFVKLDGAWCTPPLSAGLLPGVMRSVLLRDWQAREAVITVEDLRRADEIVLCNALRGVMPARVVFP